MEPHFGTNFDGDWEFLSNIFSTEEMDFAQQYLVQIPNEHEHASMNPAKVDDSSLNPLQASNTTVQYNCQDSGNDSVYIPSSNHGSFSHFIPDHVLVPQDMNFSPMDVNMIHPESIYAGCPDGAIKGNISHNAGKELQLKRKFDVQKIMMVAGDNVITKPFRTAKKPRISAYSNKNQKLSPTGEESNGAHSFSSEEENAVQEPNGGATSASKASAALYSNVKTRASRGSATDPQSLYARRRRERINERLKILQGLVPNGTKVDISTMLEEAVHYVKFLQLQIKLLSSDDMWMYAPIVYSGMDFGFNQKISPS